MTLSYRWPSDAPRARIRLDSVPASLYRATKQTGHPMKLIIGNKNYSSWSLRAWLAVKQSGLSFEEITVPMFGEQWESAKQQDGFQASSGKVPILWDGETVIWDSLAILEYCADKVGRERFWPKDDTARGMARAMVAEMHSSYHALRSECAMNIRKRFEGVHLSDACTHDIVRILGLWAEARARFDGGDTTSTALSLSIAITASSFAVAGLDTPRRRSRSSRSLASCLR